MYDSKTLECSNSSQKVLILLKKLGEIRKSSSYREKFLQGTDKFVRPNKMFEFPSIWIIETQLYLCFNMNDRKNRHEYFYCYNSHPK